MTQRTVDIYAEFDLDRNCLTHHERLILDQYRERNSRPRVYDFWFKGFLVGSFGTGLGLLLLPSHWIGFAAVVLAPATYAWFNWWITSLRK